MARASVFINYRRNQSAAAAGRLYDRLLNHFEPTDLFIDVDAIAPGIDFVKTLENRVAQCNIFVAVIGPDWAGAADDQGRRRLEDPNDYVRVELETALARDIPVIPVLVDGARMPKAEELPAGLRPLVRRQAVQITHTRFGAETDELALSIARTTGAELRTGRPAEQASRSSSDRNPGTLGEALFSFQGRLARKPYWKGTAVYVTGSALMGLLIAAYIAADMASQGKDLTKLEAELSITSWRMRFLVTLVSIPFYWPYFALIIKRLHDLNFGWKVWLPYVIGTLVFSMLFVIGSFDEATYNMYVVFSVTVMIFLGLVEGTRGPNAFGPDPVEQRVG